MQLSSGNFRGFDKAVFVNPTNLKTDYELSQWIVSLSADESERLEKSILAEGCRDPVIVDTNGIIVDGHNRHRICKKHGLKIPVITKDFESKESVKNWMIENQLARRNVTPEQRNYLIGKLYNEQKKEQGAPIGNTNATKQSTQNDAFVKTSERIAKEHNIGKATVERAGQKPGALEWLRSQTDDKLIAVFTLVEFIKYVNFEMPVPSAGFTIKEIS